MNFQRLAGQKLMLAFHGFDNIPEYVEQTIQTIHPGGFSLFRANNIRSAAQLRHLTELLQKEASDNSLPPFLIGIDQEGGQLMAVGDATALPGNMALGAADSEELAFQAGQVLGNELSAMGINVDYAPCADVNTNPRNPVVGVRSFGENPIRVAQLTASMIRGIQSQGVAATAKHFPGHGDVSIDSHLGLPMIDLPLDHLAKIAFPPFQAAISSQCQLIMIAHLGLPQIDPPGNRPASLSRKVVYEILRNQLNYQGVIITDAMDMLAIRQGEALIDEVAEAILAGVDLVLLTANEADHYRANQGLWKAIRHHRIEPSDLENSINRILGLKNWIIANQRQISLNQVSCADHLRIANEIADRSITLVRDRYHTIPMNLDSDQRVLVVLPQPEDLTSADTSSSIQIHLTDELRRFHSKTDEIFLPLNPTPDQISAILAKAEEAELVIVGTINAGSATGQVELVKALSAQSSRVIVVALRLPYDLSEFPEIDCYLCTYGIQPPSMRALARGLFGEVRFTGRLPVRIPGITAPG